MAAGTEIANAYIALQVKMPGVKNDISKALGGPDVRSAISRSGADFGQRMTSSINKVFKAGALALGGVLAAGIGTALVKGFQRLDAIDTAQAKLRGLGHGAETVDKIMQNALASVKGTAFGLGDAATVAAQAVAAGIKPGQELEGILKTVANAAAAAGTDLGDMGSIFSKAMTQANGVQNDVIGQLADKGIPIYQELAKVLGVTSGEVFKMASEGKINFDQFAQAAQAATGTVASEMGGTWSGMWNNALAAAGRFGEKLLSGIFPQLKGGLGGLTEWIDSVSPAAEEMGAKLGAFVAEVLPKLIEGFKVAGDVIKNVFTWIKDNMTWLAPLAVGVGTIVAGIYAWITATKLAQAAQLAFNAVMSANPIMLVVTALAGLVAGLVYFFTQTEVGRKIWADFTKFIGEAFENAKAWVIGAMDNIGAGFRFLWTNVLKPVGDAIIGGVKGIGRTFTWLDKNMVQPAWNGIKSALDTGRVWIDKYVFTPFKSGIDSIAKSFETAKSAIETTWNGIKKAAGNPINFVLDTIWNKGLRSFWNDVVENLGLKDLKLKKATLIKFASGGVLPGYTPGRDVHQFYSPTGGRLALSGGEAIMRPEFTRAVGGPAGVDRLNRMARNGALAFKDGGTWDPFRELGNFAGDVWRNVTSAADAAGKFLADPVKAVQDLVVDGIIKPLLGTGGNVFRKAVGQLPINLVKGLAPKIKGDTPKRGKGMGWKAMQDIVLANIPGARITSAYRSPLSNRAVGGAKASYHMQGRAIDIVPPNMATFAAVKRLFPNATELIFTPAGSGQLLNGKPHANWSPRVRAQHRNHIHLAMAQGGVIPKLYDQGGWLPHGGIAVNRSGKPEAVLTHDESQALKRGLGAGDRLYLVLEDGRELTAFVEERAGSVVRKSVPSRAQVHSQFGR